MMIFKNRHGRGFKILRILGMVIAGLLFAVVFALAFGFLVQYLWNWLLPPLFGFRTITFLQAFALIILSKILFSGIGHSGGKHSKVHEHGYCEEQFHHGLHGGFSGDDRKYFGKFWDEEGKTLFKEYIKRMESKDNS